jgi:hypothetical protein
MDTTMYQFNSEDLNKYSKEQLVSNIVNFASVVNNRIAGLIALVKSQSQDPSSFDTTSMEFNSVFQHEKTRFASMAVSKATNEALQGSLNRSKTQAMLKKGLYESARDNYKIECMQQYALTMVNDMFQQAYKQKLEVAKQDQQLKLAEMALKKQRHQARIASSFISLDSQPNTNIAFGAVDNVEVVDLDDGDDSDYNNGIDAHMHET